MQQLLLSGFGLGLATIAGWDACTCRDSSRCCIVHVAQCPSSKEQRGLYHVAYHAVGIALIW